MKLFSILLVLFFFSLTAGAPFDVEQSLKHLEELKTKMTEIQHKKSVAVGEIKHWVSEFKEEAMMETRGIRRKGFCGFPMTEKIQKICGPILLSNTETDISAICCIHSCSDEFIRQMVCPEAFDADESTSLGSTESDEAGVSDESLVKKKTSV
ncbi:hypothetical protein L5515_015521 [Caenorhabditis briggsae]|uniref:Uncharacterized protein n=1 Tax=Caenorhabditis briggsae TaxID=6238 RepID=A0AAE9EIZ8_CAEBR|nr:hypothetical protein L5515_015521 [Caenorhabditis briggsae]